MASRRADGDEKKQNTKATTLLQLIEIVYIENYVNPCFAALDDSSSIETAIISVHNPFWLKQYKFPLVFPI